MSGDEFVNDQINHKRVVIVIERKINYMSENRNKESDFKIKLVYHDLEGNVSTEGVWAAKEGEYYRIKNAPFFAPNLSYNDLISVEEDEGELFFDSLIEPSGHTTIQIIFFKAEFVDQVTEDLIKFNCDWEGSHVKRYISVDIPKTVDYSEVRKYLNQKCEEGVLDFKEACLAHEV